jgi:hypothetical protein
MKYLNTHKLKNNLYSKMKLSMSVDIKKQVPAVNYVKKYKVNSNTRLMAVTDKKELPNQTKNNYLSLSVDKTIFRSVKYILNYYRTI